jgi:EAL domain-containing protein (putative c-di-GMP-specific phosphodiesterase class I)
VGLQEEPLAVANELPVSYLKIDRSLTLELSDDYNKQKRLREIVHFARSNEQEIIAPYVQDPYILSSLWRYGIDYVQGFYIQPPKSMLAYDFSSSFS